jgi:hypothetical protein
MPTNTWSWKSSIMPIQIDNNYSDSDNDNNDIDKHEYNGVKT